MTTKLGSESYLIGELAWNKCADADRRKMSKICGNWPGWPKCQCGCGCDEPATCTDDGGTPCCCACAEYTVDDDGENYCSKDPRTETVVESCGAGNQTRSYVRLKPPEMPEEDPEGEYALYWDTVGDDSHVVSRFSTLSQAFRAVEAKDWPPPQDHTHYLCGYAVAQLVDGKWLVMEDRS